MAYRRRQGVSRSSTFKEEFHSSLDDEDVKDHHHHNNNNNNNNNSLSSSSPSSSSSLSSSSLAAQAIKASAARRDSYAYSSFESDHHRSRSFDAYGNDKSKSGFWGVLAQKAKSMLDDNNSPPQNETTMPQALKSHSFNIFTAPSSATQNLPSQFKPLYQPPDSNKKVDNQSIRKSFDKITTSLNQLGDTFEKAFEEGRTMVETKTADLRYQIRRKGNEPKDTYYQVSDVRNPWQQPAQTQTQTLTQSPSRHETQLKASRDVAMATAAKAKLLLRELKTVKADLAFAKARCAQLEEENKLLREREGREKGHHGEDDDLIRHQLETLLAEKARLANENETYSRENRFLREIVEYHQLTMQDVVYLDEGMEEVTEVYPMDANEVSRLLSGSLSPHSSLPTSPDEEVLASTKVMFPVPEEDDKTTSEEDNEASPNVSVSQNAK